MTTSRRRPLRRLDLAARAAYVLRGNSATSMTRAAPDLYPHQWSWDAAFVSVGLAHLDVRRACLELDSLFAGQWRSGMLPHIVFDPAEDGYFPGPDRWACAEHNADAPVSPRTSGICQPPVHALAVERIAMIAAEQGGDAEDHVAQWLPTVYERLLAWHRYLARERDPDATGLLTVYHGWEGGMDNSPRWDEPYAHVVVDDALPPYRRLDTTFVPDPSQRPSQREYDRYLQIVEELKRAGYQDAVIRTTVSFLTTDVFMSAIFAAASSALARLARRLGATSEQESAAHAELFQRGVAGSVDPVLGLALDTDLRTGASLRVETVAGFAPLICGGLDDAAERRMLSLLQSERWCGHPDLRHAVLPSTSPASPDFHPRSYWRGPSWPVINWFFVWALNLRGLDEPAERLRRASLQEFAEGSLAEYYEPVTGEPLGSAYQSWTAAAALDLLLAPRRGPGGPG